ncbi:MAG TPA: hypothetical protein VFM63_07565 [Pyrinomonadaceae bacterium]|nr:hypothetical protein [Pyrinomonadaceae bacterium]
MLSKNLIGHERRALVAGELHGLKDDRHDVANSSPPDVHHVESDSKRDFWLSIF